MTTRRQGSQVFYALANEHVDHLVVDGDRIKVCAERDPSKLPWCGDFVETCIALTLRKRKDTKQTNPSEQVRVRAGDRLRMVKLAPTLVDPDPKAAAAENKA